MRKTTIKTNRNLFISFYLQYFSTQFYKQNNQSQNTPWTSIIIYFGIPLNTTGALFL